MLKQIEELKNNLGTSENERENLNNEIKFLREKIGTLATENKTLKEQSNELKEPKKKDKKVAGSHFFGTNNKTIEKTNSS